MPRRDDLESGAADVVGYAMSAVLYAVASYVLVDRRAFASLLGVGGAALVGDERWLVPFGIMGNTLWTRLLVRGRDRTDADGHRGAGRAPASR